MFYNSGTVAARLEIDEILVNSQFEQNETCELSVDAYINVAQSTYKALSEATSYSQSNEKLWKQIGELEKFPLAQLNERNSHLVINNLREQNILDELRSLFHRAVEVWEQEESAKYLANTEQEVNLLNLKDSPDFKKDYKLHQFCQFLTDVTVHRSLTLLAFREFVMADMRNKDCVSFIGCGPVPGTAALYVLIKALDHYEPVLVKDLEAGLISAVGNRACEERIADMLIQGFRKVLDKVSEIDFKVIGVDRDLSAITVAQKVLDSTGLSKNVELICNYGEELKLADSIQAVVIASMAEPKARIIKSMVTNWHHKGENTVRKIILARTVDENHLASILYEPVYSVSIRELARECLNLKFKQEFKTPPGSLFVNSVVKLELTL